MAAVVAGLGGGVRPVRFDEGRPVPVGFVAQVAAGFGEGGVGETSPAGPGAGEAFLIRADASSPSTTMVPWVLARLVVSWWMALARMLAIRR